MIYAYLILSWIAFGTIHSLTASQWMKQKVAKETGPGNRYYRLLYNAVAILTLLPVLLLHWMTLPDYISSWQGAPIIGTLFIGAGILIGSIALREYDLAEFIGWPVGSTSSKRQALRQQGLLQYMRHPLYTGIVLSLLGVWIYSPTWSNLILLLAATVYIRIGIYFEEKKLVATFGNDYEHYRQRVPMLLPRFAAFWT